MNSATNPVEERMNDRELEYSLERMYSRVEDAATAYLAGLLLEKTSESRAYEVIVLGEKRAVVESAEEELNEIVDEYNAMLEEADREHRQIDIEAHEMDEEEIVSEIYDELNSIVFERVGSSVRAKSH